MAASQKALRQLPSCLPFTPTFSPVTVHVDGPVLIDTTSPGQATDRTSQPQSFQTGQLVLQKGASYLVDGRPLPQRFSSAPSKSGTVIPSSIPANNPFPPPSNTSFYTLKEPATRPSVEKSLDARPRCPCPPGTLLLLRRHVWRKAIRKAADFVDRRSLRRLDPHGPSILLVFEGILEDSERCTSISNGLSWRGTLVTGMVASFS